jgi:putative oxidoreductase
MTDSETSGRNRRVGGIFVLFARMIRLSDAKWAPLPLRLIVGYGFAEHGFAKLLRGPENFTGLLHALGTPEPYFFA